MSKVVTAPVTKKIALTEWDESGQTTVTIKEARFGESLRRSQFLNRMTIERDYQGSREVRELSGADLVALELWLTFVEADIFYQADEDPESHNLFFHHMNEQAFLDALELLPDDLVLEWHRGVTELNPIWSD